MNTPRATDFIVGLPTLTRMAMAGVDLTPIGQRLIDRVAAAPDDANALMDLSRELLSKNLTASLATQAAAVALRQVFHLPSSFEPPALRVLALMTPGDQTANTPLEFVLDGSDVAIDLVFVAPGLPLPTSLPEHDLLFVCIGESDDSREMLMELVGTLAAWPRPVINPPDRILSMSRDGVCGLLADAPGIELPLSARVSRRALERIGEGDLPIDAVLHDGCFPLIVRPVGSHMGHGLCKLDTAAAIAPHLAAAPDEEFFVSRYVDYAGADGLFRKYRVVLIEGKPFACHMAISSDWIVHYQKAGMEESAARRAEEERFMVGFDDGFARRHAEALSAIARATQLDYLGIDCAEMPDGRLLVFEVDTAVLVHALDPVDLFPYKQPAMRALFAAFRQMLGRAVDDGGAERYAAGSR